jgi:hypothetical protein
LNCLQDANKPLVQLDLSAPAGQQQAQQLLTDGASTADSKHGGAGGMLLQLLTEGTLVMSNTQKVIMTLCVTG